MFRVIFAVLLLCGCVSSDEPLVAPPVEQLRVGLAMEPLVEVLHETPVDMAVPLSNFQVMLVDDTGLHRIDPLLDAPEVIDAAFDGVTGIAELDDGLVIVADSSGLQILGAEGPELSPLSELLVEEDVLGLLATPGPASADLWVVGGQDLHRWRDGDLYAVRPDGEPLAGPRLAWGPALDGSPALWAATDDTLLSLLDTPGGLEARVEDEGIAPSGLAVDGYGTVWVPTHGDLWSRMIDGVRQQVTLPASVSNVAAGSGSTDLWLLTEEGLWHHASETFRPVAGLSVERLLGADASGRAFVDTGEQLLRIAARKSVLFVGLQDGDALEETADVCVVASWSEGLEGLVVLRDGEELEPKSLDPLCISLDPSLLDDGAHELSATAHYADEDIDASLFFSVGEFVPPTWTNDVEPLFQAECALCHRAEQGSVTVGGGHPLDTLISWQAEIALILEVLEDGRMPLNNPSLSADEIRTIEDWRAGGFLE